MLKIKQNVLNALMEHARGEAPLEACGYLAEKGGVVVVYYKMTNVDQSPVHFAMEPAEQFEAMRKMREAGHKLRAVYHSHPATPARVSEEDKRLAYDPSLSYVIVSLLEENIKSYKVKAGVVEDETIEVVV